MQKVLALTLLCSFIFLIASCSTPLEAVSEEEHSLKSIAVNLDNSTIWADELEPSVLTGQLDSAEGLEKSLPSVPQNVSISSALKKSRGLYPSLPDFYPLDLSSMEVNARSVLLSFCSAYIKNSDTDSYFSSGKIYSLVFFNYNLERLYGKIPAFVSYAAASPLIVDKNYQCPVRFFLKDNSFLDVFIFLENKDSSWKVQQIKIREERYGGDE